MGPSGGPEKGLVTQTQWTRPDQTRVSLSLCRTETPGLPVSPQVHEVRIPSDTPVPVLCWTPVLDLALPETSLCAQ